ncbi:hypothetical protein AAVH_24997, partial [Aphelenchoides avenae]
VTCGSSEASSGALAEAPGKKRNRTTMAEPNGMEGVEEVPKELDQLTEEEQRALESQPPVEQPAEADEAAPPGNAVEADNEASEEGEADRSLSPTPERDAAPVPAAPAPVAPAPPPPAPPAELTDMECNYRWRRCNRYEYKGACMGPPRNARRSFLELIEELAQRIGHPPDFLLSHQRGRSILNRYIRGESAYSPEMRVYVTVEHVPPQRADNYFLKSAYKPPYNKTNLSLEAIYTAKGMPLEAGHANLLYTGPATGSWPPERLFVAADRMLELKEDREKKSPRNGRNDDDDEPGPSQRKRPARVNCAGCGQGLVCPKCD